jgi:hypothetical protein
MSKAKKELTNATRASVTKEMGKPRMARSAKIAELNLDTTRISEQPSVTMPGTVDKIIPSPGPSQPEKAQIAVALVGCMPSVGRKAKTEIPAKSFQEENHR